MDLDLSLFTPNEAVAVALSGGKDSMCLLHLLLSYPELAPRVKAINVEHGIRGQSSLDDSLFVKDYCEKKGVPLKSYSVDAPSFSKENKLSLEEGARVLRYRCFADAVEKGFCDKVALAHHSSDNAETMLFNLFRGTSVFGMSGIKKQSGYLVRPLLSFNRQEIDLYVENHAIPFVEDETNLDENYTRNYLRLKIIPEIKKIFPAFENAMARYAKENETISAFLDEKAEKLISYGEEVSFPLDVDKALFSVCVIKALKYLGVKKDYESKHAQAVYDLKNASNGVTIDLIAGVKAVKDYDKITLYKKSGTLKVELPFALGETFFNGKKITVKKGEGKLKFDLDKLPDGCVFRRRRDGDLFIPFSNGKKKLKKYLIDKKIPSRKRDDLILLAFENEALAIIGVEISDKIKIDENTQNIYTIGEEKL